MIRKSQKRRRNIMIKKEILVKSTLDGTMQPALFFYTGKTEKTPLIVVLHTWSYTRYKNVDQFLPLAEKLGFNIVFPEFRGPNLDSNPNCTQACASELAKQDIIDTAEYVAAEYPTDKENIFLIGLSGGGHMSLMMAGYRPDYFKCISAFVPISDVYKWKDQNARYTRHILACCSNDKEEMYKRSPISYIDTIAQSNTKIFHGKYDPSVPVTQSLELYNEMMKKYPTSKVYLDIFDGGHAYKEDLALCWILSQYNGNELSAVTG